MSARTTPGRHTRFARTTQKQPAVVLPAETSAMRKARHLPLFGPGIEITSPLHLLLEYLALYSLRPMTLSEVADMERVLQRRKPAGVLWVKRETPQEANHDREME